MQDVAGARRAGQRDNTILLAGERRTVGSRFQCAPGTCQAGSRGIHAFAGQPARRLGGKQVVNAILIANHRRGFAVFAFKEGRHHAGIGINIVPIGVELVDVHGAVAGFARLVARCDQVGIAALGINGLIARLLAVGQDQAGVCYLIRLRVTGKADHRTGRIAGGLLVMRPDDDFARNRVGQDAGSLKLTVGQIRILCLHRRVGHVQQDCLLTGGSVRLFEDSHVVAVCSKLITEPGIVGHRRIHRVIPAGHLVHTGGQFCIRFGRCNGALIDLCRAVGQEAACLIVVVGTSQRQIIVVKARAGTLVDGFCISQRGLALSAVQAVDCHIVAHLPFDESVVDGSGTRQFVDLCRQAVASGNFHRALFSVDLHLNETRCPGSRAIIAALGRLVDRQADIASLLACQAVGLKANGRVIQRIHGSCPGRAVQADIHRVLVIGFGAVPAVETQINARQIVDAFQIDGVGKRHFDVFAITTHRLEISVIAAGGLGVIVVAVVGVSELEIIVSTFHGVGGSRLTLGDQRISVAFHLARGGIQLPAGEVVHRKIGRIGVCVRDRQRQPDIGRGAQRFGVPAVAHVDVAGFLTARDRHNVRRLAVERGVVANVARRHLGLGRGVQHLPAVGVGNVLRVGVAALVRIPAGLCGGNHEIVLADLHQRRSFAAGTIEQLIGQRLVHIGEAVVQAIETHRRVILGRDEIGSLTLDINREVAGAGAPGRGITVVGNGRAVVILRTRGRNDAPVAVRIICTGAPVAQEGIGTIHGVAGCNANLAGGIAALILPVAPQHILAGLFVVDELRALDLVVAQTGVAGVGLQDRAAVGPVQQILGGIQADAVEVRGVVRLILTGPVVDGGAVGIGLLQEAAAVGLDGVALGVQPGLADGDFGVAVRVEVTLGCTLHHSIQDVGRSVHIVLGCFVIGDHRVGRDQRMVDESLAVGRIGGQVELVGRLDRLLQCAFIDGALGHALINADPVQGAILTAGLLKVPLFITLGAAEEFPLLDMDTASKVASRVLLAAS